MVFTPEFLGKVEEYRQLQPVDERELITAEVVTRDIDLDIEHYALYENRDEAIDDYIRRAKAVNAAIDDMVTEILN